MYGNIAIGALVSFVVALVVVKAFVGFVTRYGHASKILVRVGQTVQRGDLIAHVGSTGIATGPHVHYEVRLNGEPQNPMTYVLPSAP